MSLPNDPDDDDERTIIRPPSKRTGTAPVAPPAVSLAALASEVPRFREASAQLGHTLPIGTRLRDYEITGLIGEGGFGIVYLAWDHSLQRKVAVKEYMPASMASRVSGSSAIVVKSDRHLDTFKAGLKSFVNEARLLARFDHPSLVKVYRFWEENGTAYMVMPYYEGPTLKVALAELGHVPSESELRTWLAPLLDALAVMHAAQCYHRDIAPDNILLTASGPLLLDFGAARRVIGDMTHALTVVLKPGYAPIEQYGDVASMTQGAWTDLYALACVVYYAITGKTAMSSVERLMDDRLEPLSVLAAGRYSPAFLRAVDAALAVKPQDRPQNDAQFRALLDADLPPAATPGPASSFGSLRHEPFANSGSPAYSTVPGTLTPVLATQVLARATEQPTALAPRAGEPGPTVTLPPLAETLPPASLSGPARAPSRPAAPALARQPARPGATEGRRKGLTVGLALAFVVVVGAAAFWFLEQRGQGSVPAQPGDAASAVAAPLREVTPTPVAAPPSAAAADGRAKASSAALPLAEAPLPQLIAPGSSAPPPAVALPPAATSLPETRPSAPAPLEAPPTAAKPLPRVIMQATPAAPAAPAASTPPPRPRREPPPLRSEAPAETKPATPRRADAGGRCSDILQKASLEPLTADEAAYLRRECR